RSAPVGAAAGGGGRPGVAAFGRTATDRCRGIRADGMVGNLSIPVRVGTHARPVPRVLHRSASLRWPGGACSGRLGKRRVHGGVRGGDREDRVPRYPVLHVRRGRGVVSADGAGVLVGMVRAAGGGDASTGKQRIRRRSALVGGGVGGGSALSLLVRVRRLSHGRSRR